MPRLLALLLVLALPLALVACGDDDEDGAGRTTAAQTAPADTADATDDVGCRKVQEPEPKGEQSLKRPSSELQDGKSYRAVVKTSCGEFTLELAVNRAPKTAASFVAMARKNLYDDTIFHRVVSGFVIQGGDPLGSGQGGPGYSVTETPPDDLQYTRGVAAMAKTQVEDPGTSGSQFFVVTGEDTQLPPDYALLGRVVDGQDVVDRIGVVAVDGMDRPVNPVVIEDVQIQVSD